MEKYYIIFKPAGMLSQFSSEGSLGVLGDLFPFEKDIYPVGRLDADSEGLLILTNDKKLNNKLLNPTHNHTRTYWAQVEGEFSPEALSLIQQPMEIKLKKGKVHRTLPCQAKILDHPLGLPKRTTPIRYRANIPTSWIELKLTEGKNRQVRKMTAKTGFPTLRLIRVAIENLTLNHLEGKQVKEINKKTLYRLLKLNL